MNIPLVGDGASSSQRSMSASSASSQELIDSSLSTSYDAVFPLYDELSRIAPQYHLFARFVVIVTFLQQLISYCFYFNFGSWETTKIPAKIVRYIHYVADFGLGDESIRSKNIPQAVLIIVSILIFLWTIAILLFYQLNKSFDRSAIKFTRFLTSTINHIIYIPIFWALSFEFITVLDGEYTANEVVIFVLLIIGAICSSAIFYIDITFRSSTAYLENTCFVQWSGTDYYLTYMLTCGQIFFSQMLIFFNTWTKYALVASAAIIIMILMVRSLGLQFINKNMNSYYQALLFQMFVSTIVTVIPFNNWVKLVLCFAPFIIMCFIMIPLDDRFRKSIVTKRNLDTEGRALLLLMLSISDNPEEFVQWTLIREITQAHPTTKTFLRIAQFLSFFPSESQLLNHYVSIISKHSDLNFAQRFLFYQIKRIHILRQSSATRQSNYDYAEVQKATHKMSQAFSGFFLRALDSNQELTIDALAGFHSANQKTLGICLEAMDKYPNSVRLAYEYSRYLIECRTDFQEGANWFYRAESMERGSNIAIDYAFRSMVNLFPVYIKQNILDHRGKKVVNFKGNGSQSNSSSASSSQSLAIMLEDCDEEQASRVFSKPKLRFALRRAIDNVSSRTLISLQVAVIVKTIMVIVSSIAMLIGSYYLFSSRSNMVNLIAYIAQTFESYVVCYMAVVKLWTNSLGMSLPKFMIDLFVGYNTSLETPFVDINSDPIGVLRNSVAEGITMIDLMSLSLSNLAKDDYDLIKLSEKFILKGYGVFCTENGEPMEVVSTSERGLLGYLFKIVLATEQLQGKNATVWNESREMCEVVQNIPMIYSSILGHIAIFADRESQTSDDFAKVMIWISIFGSIGIFLITFLPSFIIYLYFIHEVKDFFASLMLTPKDTFIEASRPISTRKDEQEKDSGAAAYIEPNRLPRIIFPILLILNSLITTILWLVMFLKFETTNTNYKDLSHWADLSSRRFPSVIETVSLAYMNAILIRQGDTPYATKETFLKYMANSRSVAEESHFELTVFTNNTNPINRYSSYIDSLSYDNTCKQNVNDNETDMHNNYRCASLEILMTIFIKLSQDVYFDLALNRDVLQSPSFAVLEHICFYHLLPLLEKEQDFIIGSATDLEKNFTNYVFVLMIACILCCLLFFIFEEIIIKYLESSFAVFRILMSRFPPSQVIANASLLNLIIGKTKSTRIQQLSAEHAVIDSSPSAIFSLSSELTIEAMNTAASTMFGYTPEQLLGQALSSLIPVSSLNTLSATTTTTNTSITATEMNPNDRLYRQAQLMKQNQAAMTYTSKIRGLKDDGTEIVLESTLLCMNRGMAFALIANDQTQIERQMRQVEEAKKSAERLLNQILPPMIVQKMNAGETEISFTVNSATIIFIDIQKFSDYAATLTARQIMQNLGRIFNYYDELVPKFPTLIKIKLIGDVYMAAAGLFNPDVSPDVHATEMINFAIGALHGLEEANEILEASLSVRIGINTGGPLIAGVLGIDKPLFDIIGDPINVASRLQSTDIPNMIQISQATYDLIKDKGFNVAERGKIFLKGKGEQMAYIITPPAKTTVISAQAIPQNISLGNLPVVESIPPPPQPADNDINAE